MSLHRTCLLAIVLVAGLMTASPAGAVPARADVVVGVSADPTEVVTTGGGSYWTVDVRNVGTKPTRADVTLTFSLPDGVGFAGDGAGIPDSWRCDLFVAVACTRASLAAGSSAGPLRLPLVIPPGITGETVTVTATASAGVESSTANNTGSVTIRYVPATVDLEFTTGPVTRELIDGEALDVSTSVRNAGPAVSGELTVTVPLPAGTGYRGESAEGWSCAFDADDPGWTCTYPPLSAGEETAWLSLYAIVSGAAPGDVLSVTAAVSSSATETDPSDNTVSTDVTVRQAATIRGSVWVDTDRDTVRDAGEPGAPPGDAGIHEIAGLSQDGGSNYIATLNADGTYAIRVRPGTYRIDFYVRDPYSFVESVDSDLVYILNDTGGLNRYGHSGPVTLVEGSEATVDAAVVSKFLW